MTEEWRPVVGYEGRYEVSNIGRVKSLEWTTTDIRGRDRTFPELILRACVRTTGGYPIVGLHQDRRARSHRVHVLVMEAFVGPRPPEGPHIRHLNGNPQDCRVENLAYGTHSENAYDKVRHGRHHQARKTECKYGHAYTPENTYRDRNNRRECRTCQKWRNDQRALAKKALAISPSRQS